MIQLTRLRTAAAIKAKYRGADKKNMDKELMLAQRLFLIDPQNTVKFKDAFWKQAKVQLKKESFKKCAYCEANTAVVAHGDVEHYRPKSIYWWLAYTYDNYLFACQICNQTYKSNNFPIGGAFLPGPPISKTTSDDIIDVLCGNISPDPFNINIDFTLANFEQVHKAEKAFLLNPYFDDPTEVLAYQFDDITREVTIVPSTPLMLPYIEAMEIFYGINRIELKNFRYSTFNVFRTYMAATRELEEGKLKKDILKQIEEMVSDDYLFAGMNRYFKSRPETYLN